jgi:hypothetical protein
MDTSDIKLVEHTNIRIDQLEKIYFTLKAIEIQSRPPKQRHVNIKGALTAVGLSFALLLSVTMLYILWIGYYPPSFLFQRVFFIDRLNDFRILLENLQNGTIMRGLIDMLAKQFADEMERRQILPRNNTLPW